MAVYVFHLPDRTCAEPLPHKRRGRRSPRICETTRRDPAGLLLQECYADGRAAGHATWIGQLIRVSKSGSGFDERERNIPHDRLSTAAFRCRRPGQTELF